MEQWYCQTVLVKTARVLVFARGAKAEEAKAAGADFVGEDDLVAKINDGWLDFDVVIATPDMMALVGYGLDVSLDHVT